MKSPTHTPKSHRHSARPARSILAATCALLAALLPLSSTHAAKPGATAPADFAREAAAARATMAKATAFIRTISAEGGFVYNYSPDLKRRAGESPAPPDVIWFEAPGTGAMGLAFLKAWQATGDATYLDAARASVGALAKCQLPSGGWHYSGSLNPDIPNIDGHPDYKGIQFTQRNPIKYNTNPLHRMATTFDDGITQNCIKFLIEHVAATKSLNAPEDATARQTLERALTAMLRSQYPNGGWPERYGWPDRPANPPVKKANFSGDKVVEWPKWASYAYTIYYTLNDRVQLECMRTMILAWKKLGREDCLASAKKCGDFLILAQCPKPQAGWSAIYDFEMRPAWGRAFEPASIASNESRQTMETLLELWLETGDEKYLAPIPAAIEWLENSKIGENRWARYYEPLTNKPVYGDHDGLIHYTLDELSEHMRKGYGFQGEFRIPEFLEKYRRTLADGRDATLRQQLPQPPTAEEMHKRLRDAKQSIAALDAQGRWMSKGRMGGKFVPVEDLISTAEYIKNMTHLCLYLTRLAEWEGK